MRVVDYQSKSYHRFLHDMPQIAQYKTRFLITFNGGSAKDVANAVQDLTSYAKSTVQFSSAVNDKLATNAISTLFKDALKSQNILLFEHSDTLFSRKTAVKNAHERESNFDLNHLFKNIAQHNGIVILSTEKKQTLSASMSTKVDVLIRFPSH
ncbi:MAG: hypothetical protein V5786_04430 [Psychromonas sp.]